MAINTLKFDEDAFKSAGAWRKWFLSVSGMPKNNVTCLQCYGLKSIDLVSCVILYWSCHFLRLVFYWLCRSFRPELVSPRGPRCSRSDACVHTFVRCYWLLVCYWCYHCLHWNHLGVKRINAGKSQPPLHAVVPESDTGRYFGIDPSVPMGSANGQESYSRSEQQIKQCLCNAYVLLCCLSIWSFETLYCDVFNTVSHEAINLHTSTHYSFVTFCDIASHVCYIVLILFDIWCHLWRYLAKVRDWGRAALRRRNIGQVGTLTKSDRNHWKIQWHGMEEFNASSNICNLFVFKTKKT